MTSDEYAQILDDFELNAPGDVMPGESLTEYINRRRREFESKANGGSIGIEVIFGPKRDEFQTGGRIGFKGGGADASKSDFKSPSSKTYSRSYNPGAGGVVQHSSGGGGGGDGPTGSDGPPSIFNPLPTKDKSTELLTFNEYTGKPMTYGDVATANNFLNFVKTQGGYKTVSYTHLTLPTILRV